MDERKKVLEEVRGFMDIQAVNRGKDEVIYTSYFANLRKLGIEYKPISIARRMPRGIRHMDSLLDLAPPDYLLDGYKRGNINKEMYIGIYKSKVLDILDLPKLKEDLDNLREEGRELVLVCYEKEGDFCHRHLAMDYLNKRGFNIQVAK